MEIHHLMQSLNPLLLLLLWLSSHTWPLLSLPLLLRYRRISKALRLSRLPLPRCTTTTPTPSTPSTPSTRSTRLPNPWSRNRLRGCNLQQIDHGGYPLAQGPVGQGRGGGAQPVPGQRARVRLFQVL